MHYFHIFRCILNQPLHFLLRVFTFSCPRTFLSCTNFMPNQFSHCVTIWNTCSRIVTMQIIRFHVVIWDTEATSADSPLPTIGTRFRRRHSDKSWLMDLRKTWHCCLTYLMSVKVENELREIAILITSLLFSYCDWYRMTRYISEHLIEDCVFESHFDYRSTVLSCGGTGLVMGRSFIICRIHSFCYNF